jgi:peroxiredoxin
MQLKQLRNIYDKFEAMQVPIFAISHDPMEKSHKSKKKKKLPFTLLVDTKSKVIRDFGVFVKNRDLWSKMNMKKDFAIPASFIIDSDMTVYWKSVSDHDFHYRPDTDEILEKLRELKHK